MVIKVDFDLTMTILAYNLYRLFAGDLEGYHPSSATTLYDRFISNSGTVDIGKNNININLKKKRNLPLLLTAMKKFDGITIPWIDNKKINYSGATNS